MNKECAAAELALKAHSLESNPAEFGTDKSMIEQITSSVDLTEAPEEAVCSLVMDLMHYCERQKIDWVHDVASRARGRLRANC